MSWRRLSRNFKSYKAICKRQGLSVTMQWKRRSSIRRSWENYRPWRPRKRMSQRSQGRQRRPRRRRKKSKDAKKDRKVASQDETNKRKRDEMKWKSQKRRQTEEIDWAQGMRENQGRSTSFDHTQCTESFFKLAGIFDRRGLWLQQSCVMSYVYNQKAWGHWWTFRMKVSSVQFSHQSKFKHCHWSLPCII